MSLGFFDDLADAKAYFTDERLVTTAWDDLATDALKTKAVINAYNRIYYDPRFDVPTYADAAATELVVLKKVNGEMAYYLAQHLDEEDRRKGMQAQGVESAGIVKEKYNKDMLEKIPIPPLALEFLAEFDCYSASFGMRPIDRDENEDMTTDVVEED